MKALPQPLIDTIKEYKSWMFNGDQRDVAKRCGLAESTVSAMFNLKTTPSKEFLDAAKEVRDENVRRWEIQVPDMKVAS
jgi:transcriptional regulator with XRE-family HTH domain